MGDAACTGASTLPARKLFPKPSWVSYGTILHGKPPFLDKGTAQTPESVHNPQVPSHTKACIGCFRQQHSVFLRSRHPDSQARCFESQTLLLNQGYRLSLEQRRRSGICGQSACEYNFISNDGRVTVEPRSRQSPLFPARCRVPVGSALSDIPYVGNHLTRVCS